MKQQAPGREAGKPPFCGPRNRRSVTRLWPLSPPAPLFLPAVGSAAAGSFVFGPGLRLGRDGKAVGRHRKAGPPSAKRESQPRPKINPLHRSVEVRPGEADSMRASTSHAAAVESSYTSGGTGLTRDRRDPGCGADSRGNPRHSPLHLRAPCSQPESPQLGRISAGGCARRSDCPLSSARREAASDISYLRKSKLRTHDTASPRRCCRRERSPALTAPGLWR